jgi:hypothetical protein
MNIYSYSQEGIPDEKYRSGEDQGRIGCYRAGGVPR